MLDGEGVTAGGGEAEGQEFFCGGEVEGWLGVGFGGDEVAVDVGEHARLH